MKFRRLVQAYVHGVDFYHNEVVDVTDEQKIKLFTDPNAGIYGRFVIPLDEYIRKYEQVEQEQGEQVDYASMKRPELVKLAKERGVENPHLLTKNELIRLLQEGEGGSELSEQSEG